MTYLSSLLMEEAGVRDRDNDCENVNAFAIFFGGHSQRTTADNSCLLDFFSSYLLCLDLETFPSWSISPRVFSMNSRY